MFSYTIVENPSFEINKKFIKNIFKSINKNIKKKQKGILNIVFVNENTIKDLNNKYRNKNEVTDVLSFHYFDNFLLLKKDDLAGEIVMCEKRIMEQSKEYLLTYEFEFYKLLIHSILHILGYDHEKNYDYKIMQEFENKIWQEVFE